MYENIYLSELTNEHLIKCDSWKVFEESLDEEDVILEPAIKTQDGLVAASNREVWCFCKAIFANGDEHFASAMCRGDSDDGPLLCSVWNGKVDVRILVPAAPSFVLEKEGPIFFCKEFGKEIEDVFPIIFNVIPLFETNPTIRWIKIDSGIIK